MLLTSNLTFTSLIQLTDGEHISAPLNIMSAMRMQIQCNTWQPQESFNTAYVQESR